MRPHSGAQVGPFELLEPLGAGGMGEVWRARDRRLRREVAIKFLSEELSRDAGAVARFEREARAAAGLTHAGIVAVHDIGALDGRPYLVLELLRGRSLRQALAAGPLAATQAMALAAQMARALCVAHGAGIVHRDLKPENLFLGDDGTLKILDFGLATVVAPGGLSAATFRTATGVVVGTLGYLAPEQLRGEPLGPPADLFGLGCVVHECLTGAPLFRRPSVAETLQALVAETPPPLAESLLGSLPRFGNLIDRCLDKDPARRPTAAEVARELETPRLEAETLVLPASPPRPARGRRRGLIAVAAGVGGLALVATVWWSRRSSDADETPRAPVTATTAAPATSAVPTGGRGTTDDEAWRLYLRAQSAWGKRGRSLLEARNLFKQAVDRDPAFARAWLGLADTYALLHDYAALNTEETFPKARAAAERALALDPALAGAHTSLAYVSFYFDRDWARAEREFLAALELAPDVAKTHQWYSELLTSQGRFGEALREIRTAQRLDPLAPMMFGGEVWLLTFAGRAGEAVERAERASLDFADFGPLHDYHALALVQLGRPAEAVSLLAPPAGEAITPIHSLWQAYAEAAAGERSVAAERLAAAIARHGEPYLNSYYRAYPLTRLGDRDGALDALAAAIDRREEQVVWMKVDPHLAPLHGEPRFAALLRSAGFDL